MPQSLAKVYLHAIYSTKNREPLLADEWRGDAQDEEHWRDTHYRIEGPVVAQLQSAFLDNWMEATGEVLHDDQYFPILPTPGTQAAQLFKSSADGGSPIVITPPIHAWFARSDAARTASAAPSDTPDMMIGAARERECFRVSIRTR